MNRSIFLSVVAVLPSLVWGQADSNQDGLVNLLDWPLWRGNVNVFASQWLEKTEMATYYIGNWSGTPGGGVGSDAGGTGSLAAPWATFQKALAAVPAGTHQVNVANGTYPEATFNYLYIDYQGTYNLSGKDITFVGQSRAGVILAPSIYGLDFVGGNCSTPGSLKFQNLTIHPTGGQVVRWENGADNFTCWLDQCDLYAPTAEQNVISTIYLNNPTSPTRVLKLTNCAIYPGTSSGTCISLRNFATVLVAGNTISGGAGYTLYMAGAVAQVDVYGNTVVGKNGDNLNIFVDGADLTACTEFNVWGNTGTLLNGGVRLLDYADRVYIADNDFTISHSSAANGGIILGHDTQTAVAEALGKVIVRNNQITFTGDGAHGILLGCGCNGATCTDNRLSGGDFQLVIKGNYNQVSGNICQGPNTLLIARGCYNQVTHNTCYATAGYAFAFNRNQDSSDPSYNVIENNIFDASGGAAYALDLGSLASTYNQWLDYNCYWGGTAHVFRFGGLGYNTLEALQAGGNWIDWRGENLDQHSLVADPLYWDQAGGDYTPGNELVRQGGSQTSVNNVDAMGAIQPPNLSYGVQEVSSGSAITGAY